MRGFPADPHAVSESHAVPICCWLRSEELGGGGTLLQQWGEHILTHGENWGCGLHSPHCWEAWGAPGATLTLPRTPVGKSLLCSYQEAP